LQTSIYTLISKDTNVRLKIIGVVHVADKECYLSIQKIINDLDYLFYEGIRVKSHAQISQQNFPLSLVTQSTEETDTLRSIKKYSDLKSEIAHFLNFADQAEHLRPKANWINADIDFNQFVELLRAYNIQFDSLSNLSGDSQSIAKDYSEIIRMNQRDNLYRAKIASFKKKMSQNLVKSANDLAYLEEMRLPREAIIIERNKIALTFLKPKFSSQIPLELGLLYGAAHTPNFVEILTREYNFEIESCEWLDAWSLEN
jgi:hypothetical protein